jgi:hypothetical protein
MSEDNKHNASTWPSIDDCAPKEEGGPVARSGFNYQDEVAVSCFIDMLESSQIEQVHCEKQDQLLSVANLCGRSPKSAVGTSLFETSLARDRHEEKAKFRIVTLRDVNTDLRPLTYQLGSPGRLPQAADCKALTADIAARCPEAKSPKGNSLDYWFENCRWDVRHDEDAIRNKNQLRLIDLSQKEGRGLTAEHICSLLEELRARAKEAGAARWSSEKNKKIITRADLRCWWDLRTAEIVNGSTEKSGGKLKDKMEEATLPHDMIKLAKELRRIYMKSCRTPRYMEAEQSEELTSRVMGDLMKLRSELAAGTITDTGPIFHSRCLSTLEAINKSRPSGTDDQSAFLQGCMYDIADRCLFKFVKSS